MFYAQSTAYVEYVNKVIVTVRGSDILHVSLYGLGTTRAKLLSTTRKMK